MATEIRTIEFSIDNSHPDYILESTHAVPVDRTYHGVFRGVNGPAVAISGDWSATVDRTFVWPIRDELPYVLTGDDTIVALFNDVNFGVFAVGIET